MSEITADRETLGRVIDDMFEALGVTDNEAALVEIDRLKGLSHRAPQASPPQGALPDAELANGRRHGGFMREGSIEPLVTVSVQGGIIIEKFAAEIERLRPYEVELRRIAEDLGEPNDPFAAWEKLPRSAARTVEPVDAIARTICAIAQRQYERAKTDQDWRDCHELFRIAQLPVFAVPTTSTEPTSLQKAQTSPDWKQDQAETSVLPRSPEPDAVRVALAYAIEQAEFASKRQAKEFARGCQQGDLSGERWHARQEAFLEMKIKLEAALSRPAHGGWPGREQIAKIIEDGVSGPTTTDEGIKAAHKVDVSNAADAILALFVSRNDRVTSQPDTDAVTIVAPPIPPLLQREWMAQALFEVDAPDHLEWDDAGIDKRERYLALADTAIAKAAMLTGSPRNEREGGAT